MLLKLENKIPNHKNITMDLEKRAKYEMSIELAGHISDNFLNIETKIEREGSYDEVIKFSTEVIVLNKQTSVLLNEHLQKAMTAFESMGDNANYERIRIIGELIFKH